MSLNGENKRKFERYSANFPATLALNTGIGDQKLYTKNISAGGALFHSEQPFQEGMKITVEIVLENDTFEKLTGYQSCIRVTGTVVRSDQEGVAIRFGDHKIMPLRGMMSTYN